MRINHLLAFALLSNSNPTWNSTELELVRVGVDFVFQCHNNKNNKNPHLILIYRKVLQVYNLGRVTVWVSRSCLEGVWKMSGKCLEGVRKVSGWCPCCVQRLSRRCLEGVWKVSGWCMVVVQKVFGTLPNIPIMTPIILPNQHNLTNSTIMTILSD